MQSAIPSGCVLHRLIFLTTLVLSATGQFGGPVRQQQPPPGPPPLQQCPFASACDCRVGPPSNMGRVWEVVCGERNIGPNIPEFTEDPELIPDAKQVNLTYNSIAVIQNNAFSNLVSNGATWFLQVFLEYNQIDKIEDDAFAGAESSITVLSLAHNRLTTIPPAITKLKGLITLNLQDNMITSVPAFSFSGFERLSYLWLDRNQIDSLAANAFSGLTGEQVTLGQNQLSAEGINPSAFTGAVRVTFLSFGENKLSTIPTPIFKDTPGLVYLNLSGNALATIPPQSFQQLAALQYLYLSDNQLSSLSKESFFGPQQTLGWVTLQGNQLTEIPQEALSSLPNLKTITLDNNKITKVDFSTPFASRGLEVVSLSDNNLQTIPENAFNGLQGVQNLMWVYLNNASLTNIHPNAFGPIKPLVARLYISENQLTEAALPAFFNFPNLVFMDIANNSISQIPQGTFQNIRTLEWLSLANNKLSSLSPDAFVGLEQTLLFLHVSGNQLSTIDGRMLWNFRNLRVFNYNNNPLVCNCSLLWMREVPFGSEPAFCAEPADYRGTAVVAFPADSASCLQQQQPTQPVQGGLPVEQGDGNQFPTGQQPPAEQPPPQQQLCPFQEKCNCAYLQVGQGFWSVQCVNAEFGTNQVPQFNPVDMLGKEVVLDNNGIEVVQDAAFVNLAGTTILSIRGNNVKSVGAKAFVGLEPTLRVLHIMYGGLTTFPMNAIKNLTGLADLSLAYNNITSIPSLAFQNFPNLISLDLSFNDITTIDQFTFTQFGVPAPAPQRGAPPPIPNVIRLSGNKIKTISPEAFQNVKSTLVEVHLDSNNLTQVPTQALRYLPGMVLLNLGGNEITSIPSGAFQPLQNLRTLVLSGNNIARIDAPDAFMGPHLALSELRMDNMGLTSIPAQALSTLASIRALSMDRNKIVEVAFPARMESPTVQFLSLASNEISSIPTNAFQGLANNQAPIELVLTNNKIQNIGADAFQSIRLQLVSLSLAVNKLTDQSLGSLNGLENLMALVLTNNSLTEIPADSFKTNSKMRILRLTGNKLRSLPPQAFNGLQFSLEELHFDYNELTTLDYCTFRSLPELKAVSYNNNPWKCDCAMAWVRNTRYQITAPATCLQPVSMRTSTIWDYPIDQCPETLPDCDSTDTVVTPTSPPQPQCPFTDQCNCQFQNPLWTILCVDKPLGETVLQFNQVDNYGKVLYLINSGTTTLQNNAFVSLVGMRGLLIDRNNIKSIETYAFRGLEQTLGDLRIMNSSLEEIPLRAMENLTLLFNIDFRFNKIGAIPPYAFARFPFLRTLDLTGNSIHVLGPLAFARFGNPEGMVTTEIKLIDNQMYKMEENAFTEAVSGSFTLNLERNNFTEVPSSVFKDARGLTLLNLAGNRIKAIGPRAFLNLVKLDSLLLSGNGIGSIDDEAFLGIDHSLRVLVIDGNNLDKMPTKAIASLQNIQALDLQNNRITEVDFSEPMLGNLLSFVALSLNPIRSINQNAFIGLSNVQSQFLEIHLANSQLYQIHRDAFAPIKTVLTKLNLIMNQMTDSSLGFLHDLPKLFSLHMSNNSLHDIPPATFAGTPNIMELVLENNHIKEVTQGTLYGLGEPLGALLLAGNEIESIEQCALDHLPNLATLTLHSNPWKCDCSVAWLRVRGFEPLLIPAFCATPAQFENTTLLTFPINNCGLTQPLPACPDMTSPVTSATTPGYVGPTTTLLIPPGACLYNPGCDCPAPEGSGAWAITCPISKDMRVPHFNFVDEKVKYIHLESSELSEIQDFAFTNTPNIFLLNVTGADIHNIGRYAFSGMEQSLQWLYITESSLEAIPIEPWQNLTSLTYMILKKNKISYIPPNAFIRLGSLSVLDLSENKITTIGPYAFSGFGNMVVNPNYNFHAINLTSNLISSFDKTSLTDVRGSSLWLYLDHNELYTFPTLALSMLKNNISGLFMNHNKLTSVPAGAVQSLSNLYSLGLTGNQISSVHPEALAGPSSTLFYVGLDQNELTEMPLESLQSLSNLGQFTFADNKLTSPKITTKLNSDKLTSIDLSGNDFETIPANAFEGLNPNVQMKELRLSNSNIRTIEENAFSPLESKIDAVYLDSNNLDEKSLVAIGALSSLKKLNLSENNFETIPAGSFENTPMLDELLLSSNNIESLPVGALEGLEESLTHLAIDGNKMGTLSECILKDFDMLSSEEAVLTAHNNPWVCDCDMAWFRRSKFITPEMPDCSLPAVYRDNTIGDFPIDSCPNTPIDCTSTTTTSTTASTTKSTTESSTLSTTTESTTVTTTEATTVTTTMKSKVPSSTVSSTEAKTSTTSSTATQTKSIMASTSSGDVAATKEPATTTASATSEKTTSKTSAPQTTTSLSGEAGNIGKQEGNEGGLSQDTLLIIIAASVVVVVLIVIIIIVVVCVKKKKEGAPKPEASNGHTNGGYVNGNGHTGTEMADM